MKKKIYAVTVELIIAAGETEKPTDIVDNVLSNYDTGYGLIMDWTHLTVVERVEKECLYCDNEVTQAQLNSGDVCMVDQGKYAHVDCIRTSVNRAVLPALEWVWQKDKEEASA